MTPIAGLFLVALIELTLGLVVWLRNPGRPVNRWFALFATTLAAWGILVGIRRSLTDPVVVLGMVRVLWATAALTLGVLVKVSAVIPLLLLIIVAVRVAPSGRRLATAAKHLAIAGGLWLLFAVPFLQFSDPTLGMANLASHEGWLAPSRLFRKTLDSLVSSAAGNAAGDVVAGIVRVIFPLVFLVAMFFLIRWVLKWAKEGSALVQGAVWGWALLFLTLTGPVLLPWYIVWTLPLAWVLPSVPRRAAVVLSALLAASEVIAEPANNPALYESALLWVHYVVTIGVFVVLVWLLIDFRRRLASGTGLFAETSISPREEVPAQAG
jgi:hypothetical protein